MEQWVWSYVFFHIKVYRLRKALFVFTFLFFSESVKLTAKLTCRIEFHVSSSLPACGSICFYSFIFLVCWLDLKRIWSKSTFFWNYFFLWIVTLEASDWKTKLDGMFIFLMLLFRKFFTLADKISRSARFWHPIQNLNSVALLELRHLNWE